MRAGRSKEKSCSQRRSCEAGSSHGPGRAGIIRAQCGSERQESTGGTGYLLCYCCKAPCQPNPRPRTPTPSSSCPRPHTPAASYLWLRHTEELQFRSCFYGKIYRVNEIMRLWGIRKGRKGVRDMIFFFFVVTLKFSLYECWMLVRGQWNDLCGGSLCLVLRSICGICYSVRCY